tara:strand:- start:236 stop:802 length:567 start_codon:yes stop_codon:yes gene_type:complete
MSPWAYFGAQSFYNLQKKYHFTINHLPFDILKLFNISGGLPLGKRSEQRKAYRMMELKRWQKKLQLPINFNPKFFPPSDVIKASSMILSINDENVQNLLSINFLKCLWVEEKDIGDTKTLLDICKKMNIDGLKILEKSKLFEKKYHSLSDIAAKQNVFGSPSYILDNEVFWGQDRLDLLEEKILKTNK